MKRLFESVKVVGAFDLLIANIVNERSLKSLLCVRMVKDIRKFLQYRQVCRSFQIKYPSSLLSLDEIFESDVANRR